jgi:integrase
MGKRLVSNNPASGLTARDFLKPYAKRKFAAITEPKKFGALLCAIDGHTGQPVTRIALQLLALLFVRPGELRLARWSEFDLDTELPQWVVPQSRMKMRRDPESSDHVVPLATQTVALLRELHQHRVDDLAFPSLRKGRPLADATFTAALRTLGFNGDTHVAHGFRASATSMLHSLGFDPELVETQLSHKRPGVRGIYFRAHLLAERRQMMQRWADYLDELRRINVAALKCA